MNYRLLVAGVSKRVIVQLLGSAKNWPTHLREKFLLLMRYNLFMGVNEMRVKILRLLCGLGLVLRLGSVQFDLLVVIVWLCYVSPSGE